MAMSRPAMDHPADTAPARRGRLVAGGAAVVLAALSVVSAFDRAAGTHPRLGALVPAPFAAQARIAQVQTLLQQQDGVGASRAAQAAVRAAPIEPDSTALLGAARLSLGDQAGAERAFLVAGQFGWRAPVAQYYWMSRALEVGDYRVAALRLDAMLRSNPALMFDRALMDALESAPDGRSALAERLQVQPNWQINYTRDVSQIDLATAELRVDVLNRLARSAAGPVGCEQAGPLSRRLVALDQPLMARAFWRVQCPARSTGLLADPDFAALNVQQPDSPFDWTVFGDSDVSLSLQSDARGRPELLLASSSAFARKLLAQLLVVPAGRYRLTWEARDASGAPSSRIVPAISCRPDVQQWLPVQIDAGGRSFAELTVDGQCPAHWLSMAVLPGQDSVTLRALRLTPAGSPVRPGATGAP